MASQRRGRHSLEQSQRDYLRKKFLEEHPLAQRGLGYLVEEAVRLGVLIHSSRANEVPDGTHNAYKEVISEINRRHPHGIPDFSPQRMDPNMVFGTHDAGYRH